MCVYIATVRLSTASHGTARRHYASARLRHNNTALAGTARWHGTVARHDGTARWHGAVSMVQFHGTTCVPGTHESRIIIRQQGEWRVGFLRRLLRVVFSRPRRTARRVEHTLNKLHQIEHGTCYYQFINTHIYSR